MEKVIAAPPFVRLFRAIGRLDGLRLLRGFALVSSIYAFWLIFDMDHYLPWRIRFFRALELTIIGHFGLWLSTFQWRGRLRFVIAVVLIPTALGISILWGHIHRIAAVAVLGWLGWRVFKLLKGQAR